MMANVVVVVVKTSMSAAASTPVYLAMMGAAARLLPALVSGDVTVSPWNLGHVPGGRANLRDGPRLAASRVKGRHRIPVIRAAGPGLRRPQTERTVSTAGRPGQPPRQVPSTGHLGATLLSAFPALVPQRHGADTVLTGLLDRSALYGVLAEVEALGLDLIEGAPAQATMQITRTR
jgi:hypothetical protein